MNLIPAMGKPNLFLFFQFQFWDDVVIEENPV